MRLIYTGANGSRVRFNKGVDIPSGKDFVATGEVVIAHSDAIAENLIKQGVCVPEHEQKPRKKRDQPILE